MTYYPHRTKHLSKGKPFDYLVSAVAVFSPLFTIPQIYAIFSSKSSGSISIVSWIGSVAVSSVWLTYGLSRKDKPIMINSLIGGILSAVVVLGVFLYH